PERTQRLAGTRGGGRMEEALLEAIAESPGDDTPRGVLADWLEEQGDARGELRRLTLLLRSQPDAAARPAGAEGLQALPPAGGKPWVPLLVNSVGMGLALLPPGQLLMGSPPDEEGRAANEELHEVEITRPFHVGIYPVTQDQYQRVVGSNPSYFSADGGG